jgi:thioredoxin-related protein
MRLLKLFAAMLVLAVPAWASDVPMGEDGLHKPEWLRLTFKDMTEDLADANAQGKRLLVMVEQRGCIYCRKMHEEVFVDPEIEAYIEDHYFVVQMNLFGDEEVTDFDGTTLSEKEMAQRWGVVFTPTLLFFPEEVPEDSVGGRAAPVVMPGAFGKGTTSALLTWVVEKGYEGDEHFQKYLARKLSGN